MPAGGNDWRRVGHGVESPVSVRPDCLQVRQSAAYQGHFIRRRPVVWPLRNGDVGDGVVVEPSAITVRGEGPVVEDVVAADVGLSGPPLRDGNYRRHEGGFAASQRRNHLDGPGRPTS